MCFPYSPYFLEQKIFFKNYNQTCQSLDSENLDGVSFCILFCGKMSIYPVFIVMTQLLS